MISHRDLVHAAHWWLRGSQRHTAVLSECGTASFEMPDVIGWTPAGFSTLIECKASRSDFRADRHKPFRRHPAAGVGCHRWYFAPKGMLRPEEMPEGWGLAELRGSRVFKLRKPAPFVDRHLKHECELLVSAVERLTQQHGLRIFVPPAEHAIHVTADEIGLHRDLSVETGYWTDMSASYGAAP